MIHNLEITEEERIHLIESLMNLNYTSIEKDIHLGLMNKLKELKEYEKNITFDFFE